MRSRQRGSLAPHNRSPRPPFSRAGECGELGPGSYRVRFLLGRDGRVYASLVRLLQRVRNWRATDVYVGQWLVSSHHARDMNVGTLRICHLLTAGDTELALAQLKRHRRWPALVGLR
jgi:hypothetical protein